MKKPKKATAFLAIWFDSADNAEKKARALMKENHNRMPFYIVKMGNGFGVISRRTAKLLYPAKFPVIQKRSKTIRKDDIVFINHENI